MPGNHFTHVNAAFAYMIRVARLYFISRPVNAASLAIAMIDDTAEESLAWVASRRRRITAAAPT